MTFFLPGTDPRLWASLTMILFYVINLFGVRHYGLIQTIMLGILIVSILVLVIPGIFAVDMKYYDTLLPKGIGGLLEAMPMLFSVMPVLKRWPKWPGKPKIPPEHFQ